MDIKQLETAYATIILKTGVNLRPGQCLLVNTGPGTYGFARVLARCAYQQGARFVRINVVDNHLVRYRIENGNADDWEWLPNYVTAESYEYLADDWARVRIDSTEELDVLKNLSPDALGTIMTAQRKALKRQQEALMRDEHAWCVVAAPGPRWARYVFENSGRQAELAGLDDAGLVRKLWDCLVPILRLDSPEPAREWGAHMDRLGRRCAALNGSRLQSLRFTGPGTDLHVGLTARSEWRGGNGNLPDGRPFLANLPTEEVYTTPDFRQTRGRVQVTRPVTVLENLVQGAWFEFEEGRVVRCGADQGAEILQTFVAMDDGAAAVGEVALVAGDSPIFQSGLVFGSILFDENASCHIALGAGYPSCLRDNATLRSAQELKSAGCNVSMVHTDFMIGSPQIDVTGQGPDGKTIPLIRQGHFVI